MSGASGGDALSYLNRRFEPPEKLRKSGHRGRSRPGHNAACAMRRRVHRADDQEAFSFCAKLAAC